MFFKPLHFNVGFPHRMSESNVFLSLVVRLFLYGFWYIHGFVDV